MAKLKPCPFCGEIGTSLLEGSTYRWAVMACSHCEARAPEVRKERIGPGFCDQDEIDAREEWNRRPSVPPVGERERRIAETIQDYLDCYDEADRCFGCDNDAGREHAEDCTEAPRIKEARAWADSILSSLAPDPASEPSDLLKIECSIGGGYEMPDGRSFWIDGPVAREMTRRVAAALGLQVKESR